MATSIIIDSIQLLQPHDMATIIFLADMEEGHLFPSFGLAHSLKKRGHHIHYISFSDNREFVEQQGFEFIAVLEDIYPAGSKQKLLEVAKQQGQNKRLYLYPMICTEMPKILEAIRPDLLVINTFLSFEALLLYHLYAIKPIIFTPYLLLRSTPTKECITTLHGLYKETDARHIASMHEWNIDLTSKEAVSEFMAPLASFTELVACPQEFDIPNRPLKNNVYYIGPGIRESSSSSYSLAWQELAKTKKIIYASMGSQTNRFHQRCALLFRKLINVMHDPAMQTFHLVLSTGIECDHATLQPVPENVSLLAWVSQIEILKVASLAITHGGLGSVKECIYHGVPMLVLPDQYDQPRNAIRVEYHQLGVHDILDDITEEGLKNHILHIASSDDMKQSTQKMMGVFRAKEESQEGARLVEQAIGLESSVTV